MVGLVMADVNPRKTGAPAPAKVTRRDRARATRNRMIRAAHETFVEYGYAGARMSDIATSAGVAVQTLYFTFHTKAELLEACYARAVLGEDHPTAPQSQPWFSAMLAARSGRAALGHFVRGNTEIASRVAVLDDVARAAAHEPDAVRVRAHSEQLRRDGYTQIVEHLQRTFGLRRGLDAAVATDLLLLYGGPAVYRTLVVDYEWSQDRFVRWLQDTLVRELLRS
jgi:AcrR family transcriptional regulator